jgi:hypothetical protein
VEAAVDEVEELHEEVVEELARVQAQLLACPKWIGLLTHRSPGSGTVTEVSFHST